MRLALSMLLLLALALWGGFSLFKSYNASFPDLSPGIYSGLMIDSSGSSVPWLVVRGEGVKGLGVSIGDPLIGAQSFRLSSTEAAGQTDQRAVFNRGAALLVGGDKRVRFVGSSDSEGSVYTGRFEVVTGDQRGKWTLVRRDGVATAPADEGDLIRWYSLWREVEELEGAISGARGAADRNRDALANLHYYVDDSDTLRRTADRRLGRTDSQVEAAREELRQRQEQLDRGISDFELSRRISSEGRLVHLSRETLERESRWIELTLKLLAPETSLGFDQALERAERVRELKRKIADQRKLNLDVVERQSYRGRSPETSREEEFYEQLQ